MAVRRRLGDIEFAIVSDGVFWLDAGGVFGTVPRVVWEPRVAAAGGLDDQYRMPLGLNCLLVRSGGKTLLLETGCGTKPTQVPGAGLAQAGVLLESLAKEGIRPQDIDIVVNSHLHFDHAGGNTVMEGDKPVPAFPRARYFVQKVEWEAVQHPNERTRLTYLRENLEPLADAGLVELVEGEVEVIKGVRLVPAPGHTAGHVMVELESGGELAIYLGDVAQLPIMLERVAWIGAFDVLPLVSLETRKRVIERALEKRALLVLVHSPYPGMGRLLLEEGKRRWEPL